MEGIQSKYCRSLGIVDYRLIYRHIAQYQKAQPKTTQIYNLSRRRGLEVGNKIETVLRLFESSENHLGTLLVKTNKKGLAQFRYEENNNNIYHSILESSNGSKTRDSANYLVSQVKNR
jgi:hypothetical protein